MPILSDIFCQQLGDINLPGPNQPGPDFLHQHFLGFPICRGPICWGPICREKNGLSSLCCCLYKYKIHFLCNTNQEKKWFDQRKALLDLAEKNPEALASLLSDWVDQKVETQEAKAE